MSRNTETTESEAESVDRVASDPSDVESATPESAPSPTATDGEPRSGSTDDDQRPSAAEPEADGSQTEAQTDEGARSNELSLDHVFGILKNQRRRRVLRYLYEADGQVSLSEVAEQIAAQENDKSVKQISSAERKRVYVGLYQCHLPKMDSMRIVSFNKPRGTIELGECAPEVYEYIDAGDEDSDPPWYRYSMALSLSGAGALVGAAAVQSTTTAPVVEVAVALIVVSFLSYALASLRWQATDGSADEQAAEASPDAPLNADAFCGLYR